MSVIGRTDDHALDLRVVAALEEMAVNVREIKEVMEEQEITANKPVMAALQIVGSSGPTIQLVAVVIAYPPADTYTQKTIALTGTPQVHRTSKDAYPLYSNVNSETGFLELTYAEDIVFGVGETFLVGPYDPHMKTVDGLWIAPAWLRVPVGL
jgi:hypothetical protein